VVMNGQQQVESVTIDPEFVDPEDVETLQDAVLAAIHDAQGKAEALMQQKMGAVTGGLNMNLPGLP
jgi:DNA-binding YbaB/EbfC family protein